MADIIRKQGTGPPQGGTWITGQLVKDSIDVTWKCAAGGTPGTWVALTNSTGGAAPIGHGLSAWTFDGATAELSNILVGGTLYLMGMMAGTDKVIRNLQYWIATAGVTPTVGQNFAALFDSSGARMANVGIDAAVTATGLRSETLAVPLPQPALGDFLVMALLFNAGTLPSLARGSNLGGALYNVGLSPAQYRFATAGTGLTAMPASLNLVNNALAPFAIWAALGN